MPPYKNFQKLQLNSIENIQKARDLIDSGLTEGEMKRRYVMRRESYYHIRDGRIEKNMFYAKCRELIRNVVSEHLLSEAH